MKHENITLSFPSDLNAILHSRVPRRGISKFVADAVRKALEEENRQRIRELGSAYEAANRDKDRLKTIEEWESIDSLKME